MFIDESSLKTFDCGSLTTRMVSRVIQGCGLGRNPSKPGCMTYKEFVPFIIASEAKSTIPSIEYWFRCLDTDGDGVISLHELYWFWEEQFDRMTMSMMSEPWKFDDFVCNLYILILTIRIDLVKPAKESCFTLQDLKNCGAPGLFLDMIFDLRKYDNHIRRIDPMFRELDDITITDSTGDKISLR